MVYEHVHVHVLVTLSHDCDIEHTCVVHVDYKAWYNTEVSAALGCIACSSRKSDIAILKRCKHGTVLASLACWESDCIYRLASCI